MMTIKYENDSFQAMVVEFNDEEQKILQTIQDALYEHTQDLDDNVDMKLGMN